jgi:hypothetical protein
LTRPLNYPSDTFVGADIARQNASFLEFWQWAFRNLSDDFKGLFAEWLVLKLLDIPGVRRTSWTNSNIVTPDGLKIDVKASSYWESWKLLDEPGVPRLSPAGALSSQIGFAGVKAHSVFLVKEARVVSDRSAPHDLKSDIYVFAFQHEKNIERWNAMDLSQWEFYVLLAGRVRTINADSISIETLKAERAGPLDARAFVERAQMLIRSVSSEDTSSYEQAEVPEMG